MGNRVTIEGIVICMWPDFGKPTKISHLVFQEIPILNIPATVVLWC